MAAIGATVEQGDPWPSQFPGLLGPLLGAVVATWVTGGSSALADYGHRLVRWRIGGRAWAASLVPLLLFFVVAIVAERRTALGARRS
jgi:hypothetical protein